MLDAYDAAFATTPLLLREPKPDVNITSRCLGFHDDSFAFSFEISGLRLGARTEVQTSLSLAEATWQTVQTFNASNTRLTWIQPQPTNQPAAYFRVRQDD